MVGGERKDMKENTEKGVIENDGKTDHLGREFSPYLHLSGFSISGQSHYNKISFERNAPEDGGREKTPCLGE